MRQPPTNAVVYIVRGREPGVVKIGCARDLEQRLPVLARRLGPLTVLRTVPGWLRTERWLHERFAEDWISGELFRFNPDMLTVVPPWRTTVALEACLPPRERNDEGEREDASIRYAVDRLATMLLSDCGGSVRLASTRLGITAPDWNALLVEPVEAVPAWLYLRLTRWKARRDELERAALCSREAL